MAQEIRQLESPLFAYRRKSPDAHTQIRSRLPGRYEHAPATSLQARFGKPPWHHSVDDSLCSLGPRPTKLVVARKTVEPPGIAKRLARFAVAARDDWFHTSSRCPFLVLSQGRGGQTAW